MKKVQVHFVHDPLGLAPRAYTYEADDDVVVGQVLTVQTDAGLKQVRVVEIGSDYAGPCKVASAR
jgi:hypothetical protein